MRSENSENQYAWICKITNQPQQEWDSISDRGYFNSLVLSNTKMINNLIN